MRDLPKSASKPPSSSFELQPSPLPCLLYSRTVAPQAIALARANTWPNPSSLLSFSLRRWEGICVEMESFSTLFIGSTSPFFSKEEVFKLIFSSSQYLLNIFKISKYFLFTNIFKYLDIFSLQISSKYLDIFSLQISSKYLDIFSLQISRYFLFKNIFCYTYPK